MERPLKPYFDLFDEKGIFYEQKDGQLTVAGMLTPGEYRLPGDVSSQFFTGLLFALPLLRGSSPAHPHPRGTWRRTRTPPGTSPPPPRREYRLPGDVSSQFFTGLLFALPLLNGPSAIIPTTPLESEGYIQMTLQAISRTAFPAVQAGIGHPPHGGHGVGPHAPHRDSAAAQGGAAAPAGFLPQRPIRRYFYGYHSISAISACREGRAARKWKKSSSQMQPYFTTSGRGRKAKTLPSLPGSGRTS